MKILNKCENFSILPASECPPTFKANWLRFFEEKEARKVLAKIKDAHFLNTWSENPGKLSKNSKAAFAEILRQKCPKVFSMIESEF